MEGLADRPRDVLGPEDQLVVLRHRERDPGDVGLLERVVADRGRRDLAGDRDHRDGIHLGVREGGDEVAAAGPRGCHAHADAAGGPGVPLGRVTGALLVAGEDVTDVRVHERVVGGQDRPAGDAEDDVDALLLEGADQGLRPGQPSHARPSTAPFGTRRAR